MKKTLLTCTQGLANAGALFGLDLPRRPQKHKKPTKLALFHFLVFFVKKSTPLD
jgi:hypothetical protein